MTNFWDYSVWGFILLMAMLMGSLLVGNVFKRKIPLLRNSLIPTSVLGGLFILLVEWIYKLCTGNHFFQMFVFGANGNETLEIITYHCLALGFIASSFNTNEGNLSKQRLTEVFNTGVTTVSTYLIQGVVGMAITIVAATFVSSLMPGAGILLPFGYGQGTGQALNWGAIYENAHGFEGGKSFGLTIAALGFLSASIGGVIHLNILKRTGKLRLSKRTDGSTHSDKLEDPNEIPMQESIDKLTVQLALIILAYGITFAIMWGLGKLIPGENMKATIYGFNFLLGVLSATLIKVVVKFLQKRKIITRKYTNNFLMTRLSNLFFDIMVVAGVAAIRLDTLEKHWGLMVILGVVGLIVTYVYNRFVAKKLFNDYYEEQFLAMYGMLTGTASTGIILLREVDSEFKTPASDNLVYQNFPAIAFGFPLMILANLAPVNPVLCMIILAAFFLVLQVILFRSFIFKKRNKK